MTQPGPTQKTISSLIIANLDDAFTTLSNRVDPTKCSFIVGNSMGKKPKADAIRIYCELSDIMNTDVLHELNHRLNTMGLDISSFSGNGISYTEILIKAI